MVILYDNGDNSDEILRVTSWFTNTERFNLYVIAINRKGLNKIIIKSILNPKKNLRIIKILLLFDKRRNFFPRSRC